MYLVTGGCGFIGSHLVDLLVEKGHEVRVLDNLSSGSEKYISKKAELICGSVTDTHVLKRALQGVEKIFHLAAMVSVPASVLHWHQSHLINCGSTLHIFEQAKKIPVVFASSAAVYGGIEALPLKEEGVCKPLSPYAIDKLSCEWHAQVAWNLHATPSVACRFFNVYGPRQSYSSPYSGVISKFAHSLINKEPITIFGDGTQRRDFIYVKDVVQMLYQAMEMLREGASVYNFCTGHSHSINELADLMMKITQTKVEKMYVPTRLGDVHISQGDPEKAKSIALKANYSLEEGLTLLMHEKSAEGIVCPSNNS